MRTMQETGIIINRPEQKGIWMYSADGTICSRCGYKLETTGLLSHCPHCSANMKERMLVHPGKIYTNAEEEQ